MDRRRCSAPTLFGRQLVMAVDTLFFGSTYSHWLLLSVFFASVSLTAAHGVRLVRQKTPLAPMVRPTLLRDRHLRGIRAIRGRL